LHGIGFWIFAVRARHERPVAAKAADRPQRGLHRRIAGTGARRRALYKVLSEFFTFGQPIPVQGLAPGDPCLGDRQLPRGERRRLGTGEGALGLAPAAASVWHGRGVAGEASGARLGAAAPATGRLSRWWRQVGVASRIAAAQRPCAGSGTGAG